MLVLTLFLASVAFVSAIDNTTDCLSSAALDLIFILDSSGSVYDDNYENWQNELDFASAIVGSALPSDTRVSTILFSGCGQNKDFRQCKSDGKFQKKWSLDTFGNDVSAVYDALTALGPDDFLGGYTWTDEAMFMALQEFTANSTADRSKMIVLVTDGEPFPAEQGHEPCVASTGYVSTTLSALRQLGVYIVGVGIDVTQSTIDDMFSCVVDDFERDFFYATDFEALLDLESEVGDLVCADEDLDLPTTTPSPIEIEPCDTDTFSLDLIFILDSSGSVYDDGYDQWQTEIDFASFIVANSLPSDSRVATIVFGGCGPETSRAECEDNGKLRLLWGLEDGSQSVANDAFAAMNSSDFTAGFTWTREALEMALREFEAASTADRAKRIIILSDGEPFPHNDGHEPCATSTGYVSTTLSALQTMGVDILGVGIDVTQSIIDEYFECLVTDFEANFFYADDFSAVNALAAEVGDIVCFEDVSSDEMLPTTTSPAVDGEDFGDCEAMGAMDLIFVLDASGSVYDDGYANWQSELDLTNLIVSHALPQHSRVSLMVFSGCAANKELDECADKFVQKFDLNEHGDLEAVSTAISAMDSSDFLGGYSWTNEALGFALSEFEANSAADRRKAIVLITDGEPFPYNAGHEMCKASTGFVSNTTQSLRAANVSILAVAIDVTQSTVDDFFSCVVDDVDTDFFRVQNFDALSGLTGEFRERLCVDDGTAMEPTLATTSDECVCVDNFVPVCCDGVNFDNECEAVCAGYNVTASCEADMCEYEENGAMRNSLRDAVLLICAVCALLR